jgi:hypothetical protein
MTFKFIKSLVATALLAATGIAGAVTVNFDALSANEDIRAVANQEDLFFFTNDTYFESGFMFDSSLHTNGYALFTWGMNYSVDADPHGAALLQGYTGESIIVSRDQGGAFTLNSFDLADKQNEGDSGQITMYYADATGQHTQLLALDDTPGLQTFSFGYTGLTSFSLVQSAMPGFQIDNVNLDAVGPSLSAVPEPQSLSLMVGGLLLLAGVARRRRL